MNIHEIMEYGPIMAHDEDLDWIVSVNGAYWNLWVGCDGAYTNVECKALNDGPMDSTTDGLYHWPMVALMDEAERVLEAWRDEEMGEDDD